MKWLGLLSITVLSGIFLFLFVQTKGDLSILYMQSPCDTAIPYRLGTVDDRFELSEDDALKHIADAASIWNGSLGKKLFEFDPEARLTISFVYDERQKLNSQIRDLKDELDMQGETLDEKIEKHKADASTFREKISTLNSEIRSWNEKGGAPSDVYAQLIDRQKALQQEAERLNKQAQDLNLSSEDFNTKVNILNNDVSEFNREISEKPEEGLYDPNNETISIYFVNDSEELVHTLAHELGHALGMDHIANPEAIMFEKTNSVVIPTTDDRQELNRVCTEELILNIWAENATKWLRYNLNKAE